MKFLKVKTILFGLLFITIFFGSCSKKVDDNSNQNVESRRVEQETLKTLTIKDENSSASLEVSILSEQYMYVDTDDITISVVKIDIPEDKNTSDVLLYEESDTEVSLADFGIGKINNLPEGYNAIEFKFHLKKEIESRGTPRVTWKIIGDCFDASDIHPSLSHLGSVRYCGFRGLPEDCNSTDWEWHREKGWWYKKVYDRDTYNDNWDPSYRNDGENHDSYQMKIDPNGGCNFEATEIHFNLYYTGLDC